MPRKHRINKALIALLGVSIVLLISQCIEGYHPDIPFKDDLLVVNGSIIRGIDQQSIVLSRSSSINSTEFNGLEGCDVYVTDDKNNIFFFEEENPGNYFAEIDSVYLATGAKFKLTIETPDNQIYESAYEEIYEGPPVDSLYFFHETVYSDFYGRDVNGARLNADIYADEENSGYYLWKIHENWETRSHNTRIEKMLVGVKEEFITTYRFDSLLWMLVPDKAIPIPEFVYFNDPDTFRVCYHEADLDETFFSSTSNISENSSKRVPLQFIPNGSRISYRYSCLVYQYSLSEGAYNYWQTKVTEIKESGGLYTSQPSQNLSNIKNINNDKEAVLGYFWVAAYKKKRVFYKGPYVGSATYCSSEPFDIENFYEMDPEGSFGTFRRIDSMYMPVYVTDNITSAPQCFDCRYSGGILTRPDFW